MFSTTYYKLILIQIIKEEELKSCTACRESLARSQLQQKIPGLIPGGNTDPFGDVSGWEKKPAKSNMWAINNKAAKSRYFFFCLQD